jgi:hypothetical protein
MAGLEKYTKGGCVMQEKKAKVECGSCGWKCWAMTGSTPRCRRLKCREFISFSEWEDEKKVLPKEAV